MYDIENFKRYIGDVDIDEYIAAFDKIEEEIENADIDIEYYENKCQRLRFVLQGMKMDSKYTLSEQKQWEQYYVCLTKYVEFKDFVESNNKDSFSLWLEKQPQKTNSSKVYSESSRSAFIRALEQGLTKSIDLDKYSANFFLVNDMDEVNKRKEKYAAGIFSYDKNNDNTDFKNAIEFYLQFLIDKKRKIELRKIIKAYKSDFNRIDEEERYKWVAVKHYKDNWDVDAPDFAEMIERAFAKTFNLLAAGQYFPYKMLKLFSKEDPEKVRDLFKTLYDESLPLAVRFDGFRAGFEAFVKERKLNHYQDLHAISVYLTFEYPEKYYIYKYGVWTGFLNNIGESIPSTKGKHETFKIECSNKKCDEILNLILEDRELCSMSQSRLTNDCYEDPSFRMLAFDIMYFGSNYVKNEDDGWWPSLEEYNPELSKEDWKKYVLEIEKPEHPSPMQMLKAMMELGGIASCKQLSQEFGGTVSYYVGCTMNLGRRVKKYFNLSPCMDGDQERYFPFPFQGKALDDEEGHQYLYRIRPELLDALNEIDLFDISPYYNKGDENMITNINKNTILYGPPGTGKTYITARYAVAIIENKPLSALEDLSYDEIIDKYNDYKEQGRIEFITFHQSYGYEEFIEGIKPVIENSPDDNNEIRYDVVDGIFKKFCNLAIEKHYTFVENPVVTPNSIKTGKRKTIPIRRNLNYVFIIDEINRGNISKIFGELITLIEDSKRIENFFRSDEVEYKVKLPYSQKLFGVPDNVYIIGTMNTADRSIAAIDTALRRRFAFEEMMPDSSVVEGIEVDGVSVSKLLDLINKRIEVLYDREHTIGHAYFTPLLKDNSREDLFDIFRNKILPLLQEYFYEDYEKIRLVLGDNQKSDTALQFINEVPVNYNELFGSNIYDYDDKKVYKINEEAFGNIEAYKEIIRGRQ